MRHRQWSRRALLKAATAFAAGALFAQPLKAAAPPPAAITPALIEAARKEGKVSFNTAIELNIAVRIERSGAERIFQRIAQEQASRINSVDVANSTEGLPLIIVPSGIFRSAPNPNAWNQLS